jgi:hypothetical protein
VKIGTSPGSTRTWTFTVMRNGAATPVVCTTAAGSGTSCSDAVHSQVFSAGDTLSLRSVPSSVSANQTTVSWSAKIQ